MEIRRVIPELSFSHRKHWVVLCLDQVSPDNRMYRICTNSTYVDETWFYVIHDKVKVYMVSGEEKIGSIGAQHESHIPNVIFISVLSRPDLPHAFDGKIGI